MLYVVIEAERARLQKLHKENELIIPKPRIISEDNRSYGTEQYVRDGLGHCFTKKPVSSFSQSLVQDSEWFALNPQEKYAVSLYERITVGPLYMRIPHPQIQPTVGGRLKKKNLRRLKKKIQNLNLPCTGNYLHSIYVVLTTYIVFATIYKIFPL